MANPGFLGGESRRLSIGAAFRTTIREGYSAKDFGADIVAGIIVALVAIPLSMSLAISTGVTPQAGLYTVIFAGGIVALLGGSRYQVTGPTAAFIVVLVPIVQKFGPGGLMVAGIMAGIILIAMGLARVGKMIEFIPYPVTTGFTAGIALVIFTIQLKDFFGLNFSALPETYFDRISIIIHSFPTLSWPEFSVGVITLVGLVLWPKVNRSIPAPLVILPVVTALVAYLNGTATEMEIATIANRFVSENEATLVRGVPQEFPAIVLPWHMAGADGQPFGLTFMHLRELVMPAFVIAILAAIESLLSAVVADGMTKTKHNPDSELIALGIGNAVAPFFGAIPATGALARTATNIRFGARSPVASLTHAIVTLLAIILFAPMISLLPMASLAALLMIVAYNMSEINRLFLILRIGPRADVFVLLTCFTLTVIFDMVLGVGVGLVLAAMLFVKRVSDLTESTILDVNETHPHLSHINKEWLIYEVAGPLFFGASDRAMQLVTTISPDKTGVIFDMKDVPVMDISGLVAFESAIFKLLSSGRSALIVGLQPQPKKLFLGAEVSAKVKIFDLMEDALTSLSN